jgi:Uri superfamily endonuclease
MDTTTFGEPRSVPGTYALVLRCESRAEVRIGRWGQLAVTPGYYIYVGSARGQAAMAAASPIDGFGCSDCHCLSHLFAMSGRPELAYFHEVFGDDIQIWPRQFFASDSSISR